MIDEVATSQLRQSYFAFCLTPNLDTEGKDKVFVYGPEARQARTANGTISEASAEIHTMLAQEREAAQLPPPTADPPGVPERAIATRATSTQSTSVLTTSDKVYLKVGHRFMTKTQITRELERFLYTQSLNQIDIDLISAVLNLLK